MRACVALLVLIALAAAPMACSDPESPAPPVDPPSPEGRIGRFRESLFFIDHDLFLAADEPAVVAPRDASFLRDADGVLGIVVGGHARAYPVRMIAYHHVVNDVIEGIPIAVTY